MKYPVKAFEAFIMDYNGENIINKCIEYGMNGKEIQITLIEAYNGYVNEVNDTNARFAAKMESRNIDWR